MKLAQTMHLTRKTGRIVIDGIEFPFYTHEDGPEIDGLGRDYITTVWLGILVDGVVTLEDGERTIVYDPQIGDVGEWAREFVRTGLLDRLPWLKEPEAA